MHDHARQRLEVLGSARKYMTSFMPRGQVSGLDYALELYSGMFAKLGDP